MKLQIKRMKKGLLALTILGGTLLVSSTLYAASQAEGQAEMSTTLQDKRQEKVERTLWGVKGSPYVRKVIVTLEEKNVSYDLKEIYPRKLLLATHQEVPQRFSEISPLGKIPAYEEKSLNTSSNEAETFATSDSGVIMEYIEMTNQENPLRPKDPKANARVSWMIQYADYVVAPITHGILVELFVKPSILKEVTDKAVTEKLLKELPAVLDFLEQTLAKDKRTWIADTKDFSLADIALVSHLVTLKTAHLSLENLIGKDRPFLLNYVKKALDRASFKKALLL